MAAMEKMSIWVAKVLAERAQLGPDQIDEVIRWLGNIVILAVTCDAVFNGTAALSIIGTAMSVLALMLFFLFLSPRPDPRAFLLRLLHFCRRGMP